MAKIEWNNRTIKALIKAYKTKPMLFDVTHDLYRVQSAKYEAYTELAAMFKCDVVDLRKKVNSILASHRREKGKVRTGNRSYWFLYDHMSFMPNHLPNVAKKPTDIVPEHARSRSPSPEYTEEEHLTVEEYEFENSYKDDVTIKEEMVIPIETDSEVYEEKRVYKSRPRRRPIRKHLVKEKKQEVKRKKMVEESRPPTSSTTSQLDLRLLETLKILRRSDLSRKKDECDSFGEYIAVSLRKHDERTQSMIKQAINNILFEQEMKKYKSAPQYVVISNMEDNPLNLDDSDDK